MKSSHSIWNHSKTRTFYGYSQWSTQSTWSDITSNLEAVQTVAKFFEQLKLLWHESSMHPLTSLLSWMESIFLLLLLSEYHVCEHFSSDEICHLNVAIVVVFYNLWRGKETYIIINTTGKKGRRKLNCIVFHFILENDPDMEIIWTLSEIFQVLHVSIY